VNDVHTGAETESQSETNGYRAQSSKIKVGERAFRIQHKIKHGYYVTFNISTDHAYSDEEDIPRDKFVFV